MLETMIRRPAESERPITPVNSLPRTRSLSDNAASLEPSPYIREVRDASAASISKDDTSLLESALPRTPRRPDFLSRGLSLQMPPRFTQPSTSSPAQAPLSPRLDPMTSYGLSATSLPRHSRGLDFSRACTNLHHSTLAESSPDSSPIITQKSMAIPSRKGSISSMMLDSPNLGPTMGWPPLVTERSNVSSSVGSINMLGSPSGSSESDDDDLMDDDNDAILATPQAHKMGNMGQQTPYVSHHVSSPGGSWSNNFSPAGASLMKQFQRTRLKKGRSRNSSSSASGQSAMPSPRTTSPPPLRSIESASGYFGWPKMSSSRRESLALGTDSLHLSSSNDSGDESANPPLAPPSQPTTPGVVRRAVTRRGNLLPKTKGFARVRAALMEEGAPVEVDVRREAETIRQVRDRDGSMSSSTRPSPSLFPTVPGPENALEDIPEDSTMGLDTPSGKASTWDFGQQASRNSEGLRYWNRMSKDFQTPPPPSLPGRGSFCMDVNMESPGHQFLRSESICSSTQETVEENPAPHVVQPARKFGKRSREDDFDLASFKRRAVSPSLSVHNSPTVTATTQSPGTGPRDPTSWGQPPKATATRENSVAVPEQQAHRSNSGGSSTSSMASAAVSVVNTPGLGPKRVGLQSMTDTNDGLMKMTID